MPYFSSVKELNKHIHKMVSDAVDEIAEDIKDSIYQQVKSSYMSSLGRNGYYQYEPTFQLLNSITKVRTVNTNSLIEIEVFFDTSKLEGIVNNDRYWNQHLGRSGQDTTKSGSSIAEALPFWLEEGLSKSTGTLFPREGWHIVSSMYYEYVMRYKSEVIRLLKAKYGIVAK